MSGNTFEEELDLRLKEDNRKKMDLEVAALYSRQSAVFCDIGIASTAKNKISPILISDIPEQNGKTATRSVGESV